MINDLREFCLDIYKLDIGKCMFCFETLKPNQSKIDNTWNFIMDAVWGHSFLIEDWKKKKQQDYLGV